MKTDKVLGISLISTQGATGVCLCNPVKQVVHLFVFLICVTKDITINKAGLEVEECLPSSICEGAGEEILRDSN